MASVERWKEYWRHQSDPDWRFEEEQDNARCAGEIRLLWGPGPPERVLELGCGTGSLFEPLGLPGASYRGVDVADSMLAVFRRTHPDLELICSDASRYCDDRSYDLIFSHGLIQYFDPPRLLSHLRNARRMLAPEGRIVGARILWKSLRHRYYSGGLTAGSPLEGGGGCQRGSRLSSSSIRSLKGALNLLRFHVLGDPTGFWYELDELRELARQAGLEVRFFGCLTSLYRIHAVFTTSSAWR